MSDKDKNVAEDISDSSRSISFRDLQENEFVLSLNERKESYVSSDDNTNEGNPHEGLVEKRIEAKLEGDRTQSQPEILIPDANNHGQELLLAPLLFNRPPFDVDDFRRRLASTHNARRENVFHDAPRIQVPGLENDRVHAPPVILARDVAQVGLNDTPLTRALAMGEFELAERLIMSLNDPEYLNDGEHADTPLNIALDGRSTYIGKPRNLRIARLLVERGADANFRVPDNDLGFGQSESPIERLIAYYLSLLRNFNNNAQTRGTCTCLPVDFSGELLDTIGLNGETDLTSESLIQQTRFLVDIFFAHGADVNLHTTTSSRSIFHTVLCAEVTDASLIEMMVQKGGLINLTDVHGTTPYMDVIKYTDRALGTYIEMKNLGKHVSLDVQNCSGDYALFRALFQGQLDTANLILHESESILPKRKTRVQESRQKRPSRQFRFSNFFRRKPPIHNIPAFLAPILCDSPCFTTEKSCNDLFISRNTHFSDSAPSRKRLRFSVQNVNSVIRRFISPLVDKGWFCQNGLEQWTRNHIITHTYYKNLVDNKVFQDDALIPLMFGHFSSGLRQQCLRQLLMNVLFTDKLENVVNMLRTIDRTNTSPPSKKSYKLKGNCDILKEGCKYIERLDQSNQGDSACVLPSTLSDSTGTVENATSTSDNVSFGKSSQLALSQPDIEQSIGMERNSADVMISVPSYRTSTPASSLGASTPSSSTRRRTVSLNAAENSSLISSEVMSITSATDAASLQFSEFSSDRRLIFEGGHVSRIRREHIRNNGRRFGENWLLRQNPNLDENRDRINHRARYNNSYRTPRYSHRTRPFRSLEGIELEISHNEDGRGDAISESRHRVSRIRQMLEETDDMLQRLQIQVEEVQTERIARENDQILNRGDELNERCNQIGNQVAALEQFNQRVLLQGRNVLVTISNNKSEPNHNGEIIRDNINAPEIYSHKPVNDTFHLRESSVMTPDSLASKSSNNQGNNLEEIDKSPAIQTNIAGSHLSSSTNNEKEAFETEGHTNITVESSNSIGPKYLSIPQEENKELVSNLVSSSAESSTSSSSNNDSFLATSGKLIEILPKELSYYDTPILVAH